MSAAQRYQQLGCGLQQVKVKRRGDDRKFLAKVLAVGTECDIALLTVEDDAFWTVSCPQAGWCHGLTFPTWCILEWNRLSLICHVRGQVGHVFPIHQRRCAHVTLPMVPQVQWSAPTCVRAGRVAAVLWVVAASAGRRGGGGLPHRR